MELEDVRKAIERHLGQIDEIELINRDGKSDKFKMNALTPEKMPELYEVIIMLHNSGDNPSVMREWSKKVTDLSVSCLKPHYPNINDSELRSIVFRSVLKFYTHICNQNLEMNKTEKEQLKRIKEMMNATNASLAEGKKKEEEK